MTTNNGERLVRLAAFASKLRDDAASFTKVTPANGAGTHRDPIILGTGYPTLAGPGHDFVDMTYDTGWVLGSFDWSEWQLSEECGLILADRAYLARADEAQLARLLTMLIRKDRFAEGTLVDAVENGLLLAIAERAEQLLKNP